MNSKTKKRLVIVTGVIVIVLLVTLALVGGSSAAKTISIAEAASGDYANEKVQVSGNVVKNSYQTVGNSLTFDIYDPEGDEGTQVHVSYEGGVSATFGNDVTAICTGKIGEDGVLHASELVTKCPSKYETATDALSVAQMLDYGDSITDRTVKVSGTVKAGSLNPAGQGDRFILVDKETKDEVAVDFDDALSDEVKDGSTLVVTGSYRSDNKFYATTVALEG